MKFRATPDPEIHCPYYVWLSGPISGLGGVGKKGGCVGQTGAEGGKSRTDFLCIAAIGMCCSIIIVDRNFMVNSTIR